MSLPVVFRRAARDEFDNAAMWYEERQPGLGLQFAEEIMRAAELVAKDPERYPAKHDSIRCIQVRRFPYSVFYRHEQRRIVVLAVFHARRDPMMWRSR